MIQKCKNIVVHSATWVNKINLQLIGRIIIVNLSKKKYNTFYSYTKYYICIQDSQNILFVTQAITVE